MKKFKPKIKEKWRKDAVIKITTLLEIIENPKGSFTNKERVVNIHIDFPWGKSVSCSYLTTKKGKKRALKFIAEELYLQ